MPSRARADIIPTVEFCAVPLALVLPPATSVPTKLGCTRSGGSEEVSYAKYC